MNFIEQLFGVAPDGGSGTTEALIWMGVAIVIVFLARRFSPQT
jgi:hypothetical protein